ncbi:MAG: hypothetical protein H0T48_00205 [Gemmatimonadaceae bacterium]|nr:hypothetical protein [Gemmatimonadaceae bacterium]
MGHRVGVIPQSSERGEREAWPVSAHEARRFIQSHVPGCTPVDAPPGDGDIYGRSDEPPVMVQPSLMEGTSFRAIRVADPRTVRGSSGFGGFLDGTQQIGIVSHMGGIPIVWGTVSAAVRVRVDRRLVAWQRRAPTVARRFYVPIRYVDAIPVELRHDGRVVDTGVPDAAGKFPSRHPAALMERAVQRIQQDRELLEQELAEEWCGSEEGVLYVDGSITANGSVAGSRRAVGIIKSHRRLYAEGDAFEVIVGLAAGERSSIFKVSPRTRQAVASWYLRVRNASGRDALFGLVRVEAADGEDITSRADEISRWVVAEGSPLALPDGRWDKMAYGIRDTEEFLRAIS